MNNILKYDCNIENNLDYTECSIRSKCEVSLSKYIMALHVYNVMIYLINKLDSTKNNVSFYCATSNNLI